MTAIFSIHPGDVVTIDIKEVESHAESRGRHGLQEHGKCRPFSRVLGIVISPANTKWASVPGPVAAASLFPPVSLSLVNAKDRPFAAVGSRRSECLDYASSQTIDRPATPPSSPPDITGNISWGRCRHTVGLDAPSPMFEGTNTSRPCRRTNAANCEQRFAAHGEMGTCTVVMSPKHSRSPVPRIALLQPGMRTVLEALSRSPFAEISI